jgi:hypothetical protein
VFWLGIYVAAMFCIALPAAWYARNEVAAVVFAVWGLGQVAYVVGVSEPLAQIMLYGGAFGFILYRRHQGYAKVPDGSLVAVAMFVPLLLVCFLWSRGGISRDDAWWPIWWLAMIQVAFFLRPIAWFVGARRWASRKITADKGGNFMVAHG